MNQGNKVLRTPPLIGRVLGANLLPCTLATSLHPDIPKKIEVLFLQLVCSTFLRVRVFQKPNMSSSSTTNFMSFYIPYVPKFWDEESIRQLFADLQIGLVERVDFVDTGDWEWAVGAFVHLKCWAYSEFADRVFDQIQFCGQWKLYIPNQPGKYFVLRKMTCEKIPSTHLNVHQLAAKMVDMGREIFDLQMALAATRVADEALREDGGEDPQFYNASIPLSMAEIVDQTQHFNAKRLWGSADTADSDDGSTCSAESAAKRMRVSEELCGNN